VVAPSNQRDIRALTALSSDTCGGNTDAGAVFPLSTEREVPMHAHAACFFYTAPQWAARAIADRRSDPSSEFHCSGSQLQLRSPAAGHHVADCGARLAVVKALAPLDPLRGLAALTTTSVERTDGSYVMAGVNSVSVQVWPCADERPRPAAG
jgi:hypothetical protein